MLTIGADEQAELAQNLRRYPESIRAKEQCRPMGDTQLVEAGGKEGHGHELG